MSLIKNTAGQYFYGVLVSAVDGTAITSGATLSLAKDGAASGAAGATLTHRTGGLWEAALTQADTNANAIGYVWGGSNVIPQGGCIITVDYPRSLFGDADQILLADLYVPDEAPAVIIPAPVDAAQTQAHVTTRDGQGAIAGNVPIQFALVDPPGVDSYRTAPFFGVSDGDGLLVIALRKSTAYKARRGSTDWVAFTTGSDNEYALPQILGEA